MLLKCDWSRIQIHMQIHSHCSYHRIKYTRSKHIIFGRIHFQKTQFICPRQTILWNSAFLMHKIMFVFCDREWKHFSKNRNPKNENEENPNSIKNVNVKIYRQNDCHAWRSQRLQVIRFSLKESMKLNYVKTIAIIISSHETARLMKTFRKMFKIYFVIRFNCAMRG